LHFVVPLVEEPDEPADPDPLDDLLVELGFAVLVAGVPDVEPAPTDAVPPGLAAVDPGDAAADGPVEPCATNLAPPPHPPSTAAAANPRPATEAATMWCLCGM
jgi:hypothetical protein